MIVYILYAVFISSVMAVGHAHFSHCIYYQKKRGVINLDWWTKFVMAVFFTLIPFYFFNYNVAVAVSMLFSLFHDYSGAFFLSSTKKKIIDEIQCWLVFLSALVLVAMNDAYHPSGFETEVSFYIASVALFIGIVSYSKDNRTTLLNLTIPWFIGLIIISSESLRNLTWLPVVMLSNFVHFLRWYTHSYRTIKDRKVFFTEAFLLVLFFFSFGVLFLFPGFVTMLANDFEDLKWVIMEIALTANIHTFTTARWFDSRVVFKSVKFNMLRFR